MERIEEILDGVKTMGIGGHVRPDGDCVGSCMALYLYIKKWYPEIKADIYLEKPKPVFGHIACMDEVHYEAGEPREYDLFVTCDVSAPDRLAVASDYFASAKKTVCIDHHVSNPGFADVNHVHGEISSASEVLYKLLNKEKIDLDIATAIYTGMIHDTGVFQYSSTSPDTMRIAGDLMEKGVDFSNIIDESFYQISLRFLLFSKYRRHFGYISVINCYYKYFHHSLLLFLYLENKKVQSYENSALKFIFLCAYNNTKKYFFNHLGKFFRITTLKIFSAAIILFLNLNQFINILSYINLHIQYLSIHIQISC